MSLRYFQEIDKQNRKEQDLYLFLDRKKKRLKETEEPDDKMGIESGDDPRWIERKEERGEVKERWSLRTPG